MSCEFEEELTASLDRELSEDRERQLQLHLPGCAACSATLPLLRDTLSSLAALPALESSSAQRSAVLTRIAALPPRRRWAWPSGLARPAGWVPALGMAAVVALAIWVLRPDSQPGPGGLLLEPERLELAANLEVLEDLEVLGLESAEDLEVIMRLEELEGTP